MKKIDANLFLFCSEVSLYRLPFYVWKLSKRKLAPIMLFVRRLHPPTPPPSSRYQKWLSVSPHSGRRKRQPPGQCVAVMSGREGLPYHWCCHSRTHFFLLLPPWILENASFKVASFCEMFLCRPTLPASDLVSHDDQNNF